MLHLLGSPAYTRNGEPQAGPPGIAYVLAAVLKLEYSNRSGRAELASFLYEDLEPRRAREKFRVYLSRLRQWERTRGSKLFLMAADIVARSNDCEPSDLDALMSIDQVRCEADLEGVLDAYGGDLLSGFDPEGTDLRDWLAVQRTSLRTRYLDLLAQGVKTLSGPIARRAANILEGDNLGRVVSIKRSAEPNHTVANGSVESRIVVPTVAVGMPQVERTIAGQVATSLAEEISIALCRLRSIATLAPHTMRKLSMGDAVVEDAAALGVDYVVSTRALEDGDIIHFGLSIVRRTSGLMVWSTEIALKVSETYGARAALAGVVASAILNAVEDHESARPGQIVGREAYLAYLAGRRSLRGLDLARIRRAKRELRECISLARDFAPAHSQLARAHGLEWLLLGRPEQDLLSVGHELARRAIDLDPFYPSGHRELAWISLYLHGTDESLHHYRAAELLAPHHADILADAADTLVHHGSIADAGERIDLALQLNPLAPDEYRWTAGAVRFYRGEYGAALAMMRSMNESEAAARLLAAAAAMAGNLKLAAQYRDQELAARPNFTIASWLARVPQKGHENEERLVEGLRKAGFH